MRYLPSSSKNETKLDESESQTETESKGYRFGDITRGVIRGARNLMQTQPEPELEPEPELVSNKSFVKADKDKDGVISESEMLDFFKGSKLPVTELKKLYNGYKRDGEMREQEFVLMMEKVSELRHEAIEKEIPNLDTGSEVVGHPNAPNHSLFIPNISHLF